MSKKAFDWDWDRFNKSVKRFQTSFNARNDELRRKRNPWDARLPEVIDWNNRIRGC
jgi:hypothetical protein